MDQKIIDWLMAGDPSIKYLASKDLLVTGPDKLKALQLRIAHEGWGANFLSYQDEKGMWGGGLYGPKWISTHYTLMTLMRLCIDPDNTQAKKGCMLLLENGFYHDGGINHFASLDHGETCVTAMTLSLLCYFNIKDDRIERMKDFLLGQQMSDGGWNCESFNGAMHSSFHTTISVLESLVYYEKYKNRTFNEFEIARKKAHELLLKHHLFKSDHTSEVIDQKMTRFSFPPRWRYDIMRALDYFAEMDAPHDPRFCDAVTLLKKKEKNGKWPLQQKYSGLIYFDMEKPGQPSRMNTLRAIRILNWWQKRPDTTQCASYAS